MFLVLDGKHFIRNMDSELLELKFGSACAGGSSLPVHRFLGGGVRAPHISTKNLIRCVDIYLVSLSN